jgi:hypothetical protein
MKDRGQQTGEVFTPSPLVKEMLSRIPRDYWSDPTKTYLDNSAGNGNFLFAVKRLLMRTLGGFTWPILDKDVKRDPESIRIERYILENSLFACEIMPDNVEELQVRLGWLVRESGTLVPNPVLWKYEPGTLPPNFERKKIGNLVLPDGSKPPDEILCHRNVVCCNALEYDYSFGRKT